MKARLYKMTTYFCVIDESYDLKDIKDFIDDSLSGDGIITQCDNEVIGPEIEWDDDIDLNFLTLLPKIGRNILKMKWIKIYKENEIVIVALIQFKEDNLWSFVNLTKGHICKCKFSNIEEALEDLNLRLKNGSIRDYEFFEPSDFIENLLLKKEGTWDGTNCSNCGTRVTEGLDAQIWNYWFPKFCPHCGAKMKDGTEY